MDAIPTPRGKVSFSQMRVDLARDTEIMVTRNLDGFPLIQIGGNRDLTLIMHPHAAKRLAAALSRLDEGEEFIRA